MKKRERIVMSKEERAAMSELAKAVEELLGKHYDGKPLGWVISMVFSDLATLQAHIDTLVVTLQNVYQLLDIEPAIDKLDEIQTERRVFRIRHWASILGQVADMQLEYDLAQFPPEFWIKAD